MCSPVSLIGILKSALSLLQFFNMITDKLSHKSQWENFLQYKLSGGHITEKDADDLTRFVKNEEYTSVVCNLCNGGAFGIPSVSYINKGSSGKKRTVFTFSREENYVQKMLSYLLYEYDYLFCDNLYSFRRNTGVKKAVKDLKAVSDLNRKYSYKTDVSDYFNSVNPAKLIPMLKSALPDEPVFVSCIEKMLLEPSALVNGKMCEIKKGIMAGVPLASFLADLYLCELDRRFYERGILYARYSDDIIVFGNTKEETEEYRQIILSTLAELDLGVNPDKECFCEPGQPWSFLGFSFCGETVDVSAVAVKKLKAKMKRKAAALVRWRRKKGASPERAVKAYIRFFNKKFFDNPYHNEITWCRWFFPVINTEKSLHELDLYMQECIRFIATEKRSKKRFDYRYEDMKNLGYTSLVNCFFEFKKNGYYPMMRR